MHNQPLATHIKKFLNLLNQIRDADDVKFESASVLAQMYEQQVNMIGSELYINYH